MKFKIKIKPKISYYISIAVFCVILFYFAYKGFVAYLIHKELYGGGLDTLVLLRASISGIMLILILGLQIMELEMLIFSLNGNVERQIQRHIAFLWII